MKINVKKIGLHTLKLISAGIILYFVYSGIEDKQQVWRHLQNVSFLVVLLATFFFAVSKIISSVRLTYFIRNMGIEISQSTNLKLYLQGMFYNLFLPGGIGGDAYKIFYLNKSNNIKTKDSFWPFLLDRISGMFSLVVLILVFSTIIPYKLIEHQDKVAITLIICGFLFAFIILKLVKPTFLSIFFKTLILSFLVQLTQVVCVIIFLKEMNIYETNLEYSLVFLISSIVSIIPITVGGLGLREWTFQYLDIYNISESVGVLIGTLFFVITLIVSFTGIYYHFRNVK